MQPFQGCSNLWDYSHRAVPCPKIERSKDLLVVYEVSTISNDPKVGITGSYICLVIGGGKSFLEEKHLTRSVQNS